MALAQARVRELACACQFRYRWPAKKASERFHGGRRPVKSSAKGIGLAIVGGGRVGLFRGEVAARHPSVEWIGLAEKNPNRAGEVAPRINADFVTQSHVEL